MGFAGNRAAEVDFAGYDPAEGMKHLTGPRCACRFLRRTQARMVILCAAPMDDPKTGT
jgi:hypothetical protein